ncbi:lytic transglycosylase domain-containing protein [Magnetovibrio sp.]|uniref:lytic transglycosylase domain-containing protein n=1 Tax=Magnetovibrio sp. TaxID=2024836 RepID=UPI002F928A43
MRFSIKTFKPTLLAVFALLCLLVGAPLHAAHAKQSSNADAKAVEAVFKAIDRNRFKDALRLTQRVKNPDLVRVLVWTYLTAPNTPAKFADIKAFLDSQNGWPKREQMLKRAEETMPSSMSPAEVMAWFDRMGGPVSTSGRVRKAEAQMKLGLKDVALKSIRDIWITGNFTKTQEKQFYRAYRKTITDQDNLDRLERLIWQERFWPARRQIWKVDAKTRKLAVARLWLMKREGNVDKAIADLAKTAPELTDHPGLIFERMRWRRRHGRTDDAADLLKDFDGVHERADKWWQERAILARSMLQDGQHKQAYDITSRHGLTKDDAAEYSEAEWVSGWIALRFLKDPARALKHFENMLSAVSYPISIARGAYWSARAAGELGQKTKANSMLHMAAAHSTTYYGQLARARLGQTIAPHVALSVPSAEETARFNKHPLKRASSLLWEIGLHNRLRALVLQLADSGDTPGWKRMSAAFASTHGRPDLAVRIAKESERAGMPLGELGYPTIDPPHPKNGAKVETPLVLAVIRQESAFYPDAKSHAGARGLMQVMPATAKRVAKDNRLPYSRDKLIKDPNYNLIIGQVYLADMIKQFDGSYPLALAAYNAGPHRVKRWVKTYGDPRAGEIDTIDWVELIPYSETRNYVQRVLENLGVYRAHLGDRKVAHDDLFKVQDLVTR